MDGGEEHLLQVNVLQDTVQAIPYGPSLSIKLCTRPKLNAVQDGRKEMEHAHKAVLQAHMVKVARETVLVQLMHSVTLRQGIVPVWMGG